MTIVMTLEAVKEAARKAYEEKRLTAQNGGLCEYKSNIDGKECVCAVGAFLEKFDIDFSQPGPEALIRLNHTEIFRVAKFLGIVVNRDDLKEISHIQRLHDKWARREGLSTSLSEAQFRDIIYK